MASRLLNELAARIAATRDPIEAACLRAQRSVYLARQGNRDEAQAVVQAIRQEFDAAPNAAVTAWVSLAEALIHFYSHPGPQAMDRLKRAHALSRAINHPVLVPLCEAWLAHMEFNANRMEPMLAHAVEALRLSQPDHHAALARVSLVIADAFHFAGRFDLAKDWYAAVREHALADGDDATISAMLHNVATLRANHVRVANSFGRVMPLEARRAFLEAESTRHYDFGIGTLALSSFVPLVLAQLFTAEGRFAEAVPIYCETLDHERPENLARREACFFGDRAWCYMNLGEARSAMADVHSAERASYESCDADDLASAHARVAAVLRSYGRDQDAAEHRKLATRFLRRHQAAQKSLLGCLLRTAHTPPRLN